MKEELTFFLLRLFLVFSTQLTSWRAMAGPQFTAQIKTGSQYRPNEEIPLEFTLTNNNEDDYYVLAWKTPLEGFYGNFLDVERGEEHVQYKGPMVKRGNPLAEDYVLIQAGSSAKATVKLNEGYDVSKPGQYQVKLRTALMDVKRKSDGQQFQPTKLSEGKTRVELSSDSISFVIGG